MKLFYLPNNIQFHFAIIGEELGFIGSGAIIILFFLLAWRGYKVAVTARIAGSCWRPGRPWLPCKHDQYRVVTATLPITGIRFLSSTMVVLPFSRPWRGWVFVKYFPALRGRLMWYGCY